MSKTIRTGLLVIDLQKEFKDEDGEKYKKILNFINRNENKYDYILGTRFINNDRKYYEKKLNWGSAAMHK